MTSKYKRIFHQLVFWLFIFYCLCLTLLCIGFRLSSYNEILKWFTTSFPEAYLIQEYSEKVFTPTHFAHIRHLTLVLISALILLTIAAIIKRNVVLQYLDHLTLDVRWLRSIHREAFTNISQRERYTVMGCLVFLVAIKCWLFNEIPFYVDEVFNFVYFAKQGFLHSTIYTNNHVAYNFATALWWKLGLSPLLASRLTALLSGIVLHIFLYAVIRHYFNFRTAILVLLITGVSFWPQVYSVLGVGYMPLTLCVVVSIVALGRIFHDNNNGYSLFSVSCAAGFCFNKLFIIPMIALIITWLCISGYIRKWTTRTVFLKSLGLIILFSMLFYLPMYLWCGSASLFTAYVGKDDVVKAFPALLENFSAITEINTKTYIVLAVVFFGCVFCFGKVSDALKLLIVLNASFLLAMLLFIAVLRVYPPSRTIIYMNVIFFTLIGAGTFTLITHLRLNNWSQVAVFAGMVTLKVSASICLFNYGAQNYYGSFQDREFYKRLRTIASCIIAQKPKLIYADDQNSYLDFYLKLEKECQGTNVSFSFKADDLKKADVVVLQHADTLPANSFYHLPIKEFGSIYTKDSKKSLENCVHFH